MKEGGSSVSSYVKAHDAPRGGLKAEAGVEMEEVEGMVEVVEVIVEVGSPERQAAVHLRLASSPAGVVVADLQDRRVADARGRHHAKTTPRRRRRHDHPTRQRRPKQVPSRRSESCSAPASGHQRKSVRCNR